MNYFIGKNGQQLGPFTEEQIRSMAQGGMCHPSDLCWHEGRTSWVPLTELFSFPLPSPPLVPVPPLEGIKLLKTEQFLHYGAAGYVVSVIYCIRALVTDNPDHIAPWFIVWLIVASVLSTIYSSILHWKCWRALPEPFRATTPGKAIGFLFIPFFNFYWAFVTWPKLAEGIEKWRKSAGRDTPAELKVLATVHASLWVSSFVAALALPPGTSILVDSAGLVFFLLFYIKAAAAINGVVPVSLAKD